MNFGPAKTDLFGEQKWLLSDQGVSTVHFEMIAKVAKLEIFCRSWVSWYKSRFGRVSFFQRHSHCSALASLPVTCKPGSAGLGRDS